MSLDLAVSKIDGVGKFYALLFAQNNVKHLKDVLFLIPKKIIRKQSEHILMSYTPNSVGEVSLKITVEKVQKGQKTIAIFAQNVKIIFFSTKLNIFFPGTKITIFGKPEIINNLCVFTQPKWKLGHIETFVEIDYKLEKLHNAVISKIVTHAINALPNTEWCPEYILRSNNWHTFKEVMQRLHSGIATERDRRRLAFDEAIANQYAIYDAQDIQHSKSYQIQDISVSEALDVFDYPLTEEQEKVWEEIKADLISEKRMTRILYGDVGSGKTIVALLALLMCCKSGRQAAMLAPTEILANQHYELCKELLPNVKITLLTRKSKGKKVYKAIENEVCIIFGTHAILQEKVIYKNLGLLIIDEQHRFGVMQRMMIKHDYNVLLMTATPIPRTLKLSQMGQIPISSILSRPQKHEGREVHMTRDISNIYASIKKALDEDDNVFWVCPFVEKSEKKFGMDVYTRSKLLTEEFGDIVTTIHSRSANKDEILRSFKSQEKRILVSTTVIEVGVNIPNANLMIIENAELFGLSQLYQIIGRVGRGTRRGICYLFHQNIGINAYNRLRTIIKCKSGIEIAEQDMLIRGSGNILGTEQNGFFENKFRFLKLNRDIDLIDLASDTIQKYVEDKEFIDKMRLLSSLFSYISSPWLCG